MATPETASALVLVIRTVPWTTPPAAWPDTATVAVGGVVSIVIVRPGPIAVAPSTSVAPIEKQNVPSPGGAKCCAVVLSGYVLTAMAGVGGWVQAPGARNTVWSTLVGSAPGVHCRTAGDTNGAVASRGALGAVAACAVSACAIAAHATDVATAMVTRKERRTTSFSVPPLPPDWAACQPAGSA